MIIMNSLVFKIIENMTWITYRARFKDNKLYLTPAPRKIVELNKYLNKTLGFEIREIYKLLMVIKLGDRPGAWLLLNNVWFNIIPAFDIFKLQTKRYRLLQDYNKTPQPGYEYYHLELFKTNLHLQYFFKSIPVEHLEIIKKFDRKFWWRSYFFLNRHKEVAVELYNSTPVIFFMLACLPIFVKKTHPWRIVDNLIKKKQKDILKYFDFPGTNSMVNVLRKMQTYSISIGNLKLLRKTVTDDTILYKLQNLKKYSILLFIILRNDPWISHCSINFLLQITRLGKTKRAYHVYRVLKDLFTMCGQLNENETPMIHGLKSLGRLHSKKIHEIIAARKIDSVYYGPSPIPPIEGITPIETSDALFEESIKRKNCLASYHESIVRKECYVYHVNKNGKYATLLIEKIRNGGWRIGEMRDQHNCDPPFEIYAFVKKWLIKSDTQSIYRDDYQYEDGDYIHFDDF